MDTVLERVQSTISRYNMIPSGARVGVAVSGGADSVFLLQSLRASGVAPLSVLHVNHGLRGAASHGDEEFVRALAGSFELPFHLLQAAPLVDGNLEQHCRRQRLAFFAKCIAGGLADRVATGHTASDQAETVLLRLLRGTGPAGLRGILPVTAAGVIRPLLELSRDEIREWLTERGIAWREDASNASPRFLRNRVRAELLPMLRQWQPEIETGLSRLAGAARVDEEYWSLELARILPKVARPCAHGVEIDCKSLNELHPALGLRVLRASLGSLQRIDQQHLHRALALTAPGLSSGSCDLPSGGRVVRSMNRLLIAGIGPHAAIASNELPVPGETLGPGFTLETRIDGNLHSSERYTGGEGSALDWEKLRGTLLVRHWKPGDRFCPAGSHGERSLKKLFQSARVPLWERSVWPIISDSDGIVWVKSFGAAERSAASACTKIFLRIQYRGTPFKSLVE